jgi:hypothetical protein
MPARTRFSSFLALALCWTLTAAKKPLPITDGVASNELVSIKATLYADPASIQELLGSTLDGHYTVIQLDVHPNKKFTIDHDNFLLRTDKDGEKAHVYEPTQIAGDGALVVTTTDDEQADRKKGGNSGITMGGMGAGMGGSPGMVQSAKPISARMEEGTGKKNPVLDTLRQRMLPQKDVEDSISGLLYFPMEKQRIKDLELIVTTPSGKLSIRFSK